MKFRPAVAFACFALVTRLGAQVHPHEERGFDPEKLYQFGEVDQVDLQSLGLSIQLPIGPQFPLSERFSYGLTLSYSAKVWDFIDLGPPLHFVKSTPDRASNSGWGWQLHLGRLLAPADPIGAQGWRYYSPDGGEHQFWSSLHTCENGQPPPNGCGSDGDPDGSWSYTRDGSFLRMHAVSASQKDVEHSDGSVHRFDLAAGKWRLTEIRDRYGNWVRVDYTTEANVWRITDILGRLHRVYFSNRPYDGVQVPMVDKVEVAAFGGATAEYDFRYFGDPAEPGQWGDPAEPADAQQRRDVRHTNGNPNNPNTYFTAVRLSAVMLPDGPGPNGVRGTHWRMEYHNEADAWNARGQIKSIRYPTGGKIRYAYARREMAGGEPCPSDDFINNWELVLADRIIDENGDDSSSDPMWSYVPELSNYYGTVPQPCASDPNWPKEQLLVRVITPLLDRTEYFFSIWSNFPLASQSGFKRIEFGLPFTRGHVDTPNSSPVGNKFLSSKAFDCDAVGNNCEEIRREYVRYQYDGEELSSPTLDFATQRNRRVAGRRTVYLDDSSIFSDVEYEDYDGLGHFRKAITDGSFGTSGANVHTTFTRFNPTRGTFGDDYTAFPVTSNWVLGTYDRVDEMGGSEITDVSRKYFEFNTNTGFLNCVRSLRDGATSLEPGPQPSNRDVIAQYTDSNGNLDRERHYGADKPQGGIWLPVSTSCSNVGSRAPDYSIEHGQSHGVRNFSAYLPVPHVFKSLDLDIDSRTGLPSVSRDTAGVPTTFNYDRLGRLTRITPGGTGEVLAEAWTDIKLTDVTPPLVAEIYRCNAGSACTGNDRLTSAIHEYDGFGRTKIERRKFQEPNENEVGWNERFTTYDAMGHRTAVSGWQFEGDSTPNWTTFDSYDAFGRVLSMTLPDGYVTEFEYLGIRWAGTKTDIDLALGGSADEDCSVHWEGFDRLGRLWKVEEDQECDVGAAQSKTVYSYDESGRLAKVCQKDGSGSACDQSRLFAYDNRGFLTSETHPEKGANGNGAVTYSAYDSRGHALKRQEVSASRVLDYTYDFAERLLTVKNGTTTWKDYVYDTAIGAGEGKVKTAMRLNIPGGAFGASTPVKVTETYAYSEVGGRASERKTQVTVNTVDAELWTTQFAYNGLGFANWISYPRCAGASCGDGSATPARIGSSTYSQGLLSTVSFASSNWATLSYHPNLQVEKVTHGNAMTEEIANDLDDMHRPRSITVALGADRWPPAGTNDYVYDGAGNILRIGSAASGDLFQYDRLSRLTKGKLQTVSPVPQQTYAFDPFGNLSSMTTQIGTGTPTTETFDTSASTNHLQNLLNPPSIQYDDGGNLTYWNVNKYTYDLLNSMSRYCSTWNGSACTGEDWSYVYTADDERLISVKADSSRAFWTVRDLAGRVLTRDERAPIGGLASRGNIRESMTVEEYLLLIFADGFESGNTLAWSSTSTGATRGIRDYVWRGDKLLGYNDSQGFRRHFGLDHLGTVRVISGDVIDEFLCEHHYYPFGREASSTCQDAEPMKYTGHERDLQSTPSAAGDDLDYMHARFISPVTGRFLSVDDVLGDRRRPQSWNRYAYVSGNPTKYIDPDGRQEQLPIDPAKASSDPLGTLLKAVSDIAGAQPMLMKKSELGKLPNLEDVRTLASAVEKISTFGELFKSGERGRNESIATREGDGDDALRDYVAMVDPETLRQEDDGAFVGSDKSGERTLILRTRSSDPEAAATIEEQRTTEHGRSRSRKVRYKPTSEPQAE